jgi:hypothetical protein
MFKRLLMAGILAAGLASAQDEMGGGGGSRGGGGGRGGDEMGGGGGVRRRVGKLELFVDKLKLNNQQKEEAQRTLNAALERLGAPRAEMENRRAKIAGAIIDGKPAGEVAKLTAEFAEMSAQVMKIEADAFAKVWATLKPNQQSKADQAFELLTGVFAQAGRARGGGPGGGMGRGRGGAGR